MNNLAQPAFIADYQSCFEQTWSDNSDPESVRFVVLDCETTGTDPRRDKLISIGAVVVEAGEIVLEDSFEVLLKVAYNASAVTVHGITRDEAADGLSEAEALTAFLPWLRDGVIVGHHIGFDITMIDLACQQLLNFELRNRSLDTMALTLLLEEDGAFKDQQKIQSFSLDALCSLFGVIPHDRHTAGGDAFITAQVFLRLLRLAKRHGRINLGELCEPFNAMD